jgi:cell shape-determining protein MreC
VTWGCYEFQEKKREYLKGIINEITTNSKNKNIRDLYREINKFKRDYEDRNDLVKEENDHLLADSHNFWVDDEIISLPF